MAVPLSNYFLFSFIITICYHAYSHGKVRAKYEQKIISYSICYSLIHSFVQLIYSTNIYLMKFQTFVMLAKPLLNV